MIDYDRERKVRQKIQAADKAYYDDDKPIMTDEEYDKLKRSYEEEYGALDYVPGNFKEGFEQFTHPVPLLSLNKLFDDDSDINSKISDIAKKFSTICLQPKIDGLTVAAYPNADGSYKFVTRGRGGVTGEVLPAFIPSLSGTNMKAGKFSVRGEAFITKPNFKTIQQLQVSKGEEPFSNPRNAAAGILRNKEKSPYLDYLSYIVYDIPGSHGSVKQDLELLSQTNFSVISYKVSNGKDLLLLIRNYWQWLSEQDIPVDGVVLKTYDMEDSYYVLGQTKHHPNNAIAWKRAADIYETKVTSVIWQVGRDKITPVAQLEPVEIDGTTISRATLHNFGFFKKLNLKRGDIVSLCKSGEVIPKVLSVTQRTGKFPIAAPSVCPSCNHKLEVFSHDDIFDIRCTNSECKERIVQNIAFLAGKDVLDIKGLSESTARKIVDKFGTASRELVIFDLTVKDILTLPGFAQKSAENLYGNLLKSLQKPVTIPVLFKTCCVTGIGGSIGAILEKKFKNINSIIAALDNPLTLKRIEGIGDKTATVLTGDTFKAKLNEILELLTVAEPEEKTEGPLKGTVWVITGKLPISRTQVESLIMENGGDIAGAVSRKVDYLLTADITSNSTKTKKAREFGIKIVTYDYLLNAVNKQ